MIFDYRSLDKSLEIPINISPNPCLILKLSTKEVSFLNWTGQFLKGTVEWDF